MADKFVARTQRVLPDGRISVVTRINENFVDVSEYKIVNGVYIRDGVKITIVHNKKTCKCNFSDGRLISHLTFAGSRVLSAAVFHDDGTLDYSYERFENGEAASFYGMYLAESWDETGQNIPHRFLYGDPRQLVSN